jgi:hypothetical protein
VRAVLDWIPDLAEDPYGEELVEIPDLRGNRYACVVPGTDVIIQFVLALRPRPMLEIVDVADLN